jgi:Transposase, Mutator family
VLARVPRGSAEMVAAAIRTIFAQPTGAEVTDQVDKVAAMLAPKFPAVATLLTDAREDLTAFASFPPAHWVKIWSTDESFKARVALLAGSGVVRLGVGRGRPRSEEQGRGAGSPAAQLCPLRALPSRPSGGGHAPIRLLLGRRLRLPAGHESTVGDLGLLGERPLAPAHLF